MGSGLVGSEMCIRDRLASHNLPTRLATQSAPNMLHHMRHVWYTPQHAPRNSLNVGCTTSLSPQTPEVQQMSDQVSCTA
eukprot:5484492-Pyramimonas_sp.AAC.1